MGRRTHITTGLPQGGVLSPILWLMYFNSVIPQLRARRVAAGLPEEWFLTLLFADDITIVISAPTLQELCTLANFSDQSVREVLHLGTLQI